MATMLCVSVTERSAADAIDAMRMLPPGVGAVEIRLDMMAEPDVERIVEARDRAVIATCRSAAQGGFWEGEEAARLALLRRGAAAGAEYVDLEWECRARAGELELPGSCRLILSEHDFDGTRGDLDALRREMSEVDGAVVKIATTAQTILDALRMLDLVRRASDGGRPMIGLCMGEAGLVTRVLAPKAGALLSYAAARAGAEAAPGQIPCEEMLGMYRFGEMGAETKVYGVIANPVGHSMSPAIQNAAFAEADLDAVYLPLKVEDCAAFVKAFAGWDVGGYSVTIPHKEAMVPLMDEVEELVRRIGVLNTVVVGEGGRMRGYNTDVGAAVGAIAAACERAGWGEAGSALRGKRVLLLGAGGAGRALGYGLTGAGASLVIANRTVSRAETLAAELGAEAVPLEGLDEDVAYDVLVNTTAVGMYPKVDDCPVRAGVLREGAVVFDAVYNPLETKLLRLAGERGCVTASGLEWFVGQAARQFELWTGREAPAGVMREVVLQRLGRGD
jgi:3-dehydroquinate dehydratase/shikimate dehydrogenase